MPVLVYVAGGVFAAGLIGYGGYKVYQYVTATQAAEGAKEEGLADAGVP